MPGRAELERQRRSPTRIGGGGVARDSPDQLDLPTHVTTDADVTRPLGASESDAPGTASTHSRAETQHPALPTSHGVAGTPHSPWCSRHGPAATTVTQLRLVPGRGAAALNRARLGRRRALTAAAGGAGWSDRGRADRPDQPETAADRRAGPGTALRHAPYACVKRRTT